MANIELPKDAEGREIPLDTKTLYDNNGDFRKVIKFIFYPYENIGWNVCLENDFDGEMHDTNFLHLTPPDSWEKLEEDLGKIANNPGEVVCAYFGREIEDCEGCKLENCEYDCSNVFLRDVIDRIRKLRGEGDA